MAGKFNRKVKYQKKNFNIYKNKGKFFDRKAHQPPVIQKQHKPKFEDLPQHARDKFKVEQKGLFSSIFDDLVAGMFRKR